MYHRDLLPDERHFLDVLLSSPFEGRDELKAQAAVVSVSGQSCACGCPSLALAVDRDAPPAAASGMVADGVGVDRDGNVVGVLLWVDDRGYMDDLEVHSFSDTVDGRPTEGSWGKPTVESFELAEWELFADGTGGTLKNTPGHKTPDKV